MKEYRVERSMRKTISMRFKNQELIVKAPFFVTKGMIDDFVNKNTDWIEKQVSRQEESILDPEKIDEYKKEARAYIVPTVEKYALKFGFHYNKIRITSATTRWGSCSSKKNLNFSYRLILAPKEAVDYVIVHELCHLRQMNHSKKFWNEVANIMPDYKIHEKWLKQHGYKLH
jgi:predicted metal-dependent hydrolase